MKFYNSLTKTKEEFKPIDDNLVGVYTCGPTVYSYVTIGNWRTYVLGDIVVRTLKYFGYQVDYVMNITDVGHLTGDNLGDADTGIDRLEKAARSEGKTAWDIAEYYAQDFVAGFEKLNLTWPTLPKRSDDADKTNRFCKATEHIQEQIQLIKAIEQVGFTYRISDGIYFDVQAYESAGHNYGQLSTLDQVKAGARVEPNPEKKHPRDFALWKFSPTEEKRQMEWDSPWGVGFPGWHIECSAMSMKYLGKQFDIHLGGEDLRSTHHPNEIAQAEAVTGKQFVRYWLHGAFLLVDGGRMGKSLGNAYTLSDVLDKGFSPMDLKYFYYSGHYRKPLNFTWESLKQAQLALESLYKKAEVFADQHFNFKETRLPSISVQKSLAAFDAAIHADLNIPQAMAALHQALDAAENEHDEMYIFQKIDPVLGLDFEFEGRKRFQLLQAKLSVFQELLQTREMYKKEKKFDQADKIRDQIKQQGYLIEDTAKGPQLKLIDTEKPKT